MLSAPCFCQNGERWGVGPWSGRAAISGSLSWRSSVNNWGQCIRLHNGVITIPLHSAARSCNCLVVIYSANCSCDNVTLDRGSDTKAGPAALTSQYEEPHIPPPHLSQSWHGQMTAGVKSQNVLASHSFGDPLLPAPKQTRMLKFYEKDAKIASFLLRPLLSYFQAIANIVENSRLLTWVSSNLDKFAFFGIISGPMQWTTFCPPIKYGLFTVSHKNSMEMRKWNGIFDYRI